MNLVILGPQGSGKGTQAEKLVEKFGFNYVEMGKILRSIANSNNPHSKEVKELMEKGEKVSDEFVRLIAWDHISKVDRLKGFVFDGYPRSVAQYEHLEDMLRKFGQKIDKVIYIWISEAEVVKRLSARRVCIKCGAIYNLITNPPLILEKCNCGGELEQREDDQPDAIRKRLEWGWAKDVKDRAEQEGNLLEINGEQPIADIHTEIVEKLEL